MKNLENLTELKKKYRILSKKYHPDLNPNVDEEIFKQINAEHKYLLANPDKIQVKQISFTKQIKAYHSTIKRKGYKVGSLWYHYLDLLELNNTKATIEDIELIAKLCDYSKGWVYYKIKELNIK